MGMLRFECSLIVLKQVVTFKKRVFLLKKGSMNDINNVSVLTFRGH